jgi:hypothetical protein
MLKSQAVTAILATNLREFLSTEYSEDAAESVIPQAWLDSLMGETSYSEAMDFAKGTVCGRGWTGTKPGCKRAKKGVQPQANAAISKPKAEMTAIAKTKPVEKPKTKPTLQFKTKVKDPEGLSKILESPDARKVLFAITKSRDDIRYIMGELTRQGHKNITEDYVFETAGAMARAIGAGTATTRKKKQKALADEIENAMGRPQGRDTGAIDVKATRVN